MFTHWYQFFVRKKIADTIVEDIVNIVNVNSLTDSVSVTEDIFVEDIVNIVNVNSLTDLVFITEYIFVEDIINIVNVNSLTDSVSVTEDIFVEDIVNIVNVNSLTDLVSVTEDIFVEDIISIVNVNSLIDSVFITGDTFVEDIINIVNVNSLTDSVSVTEYIFVEDTINIVNVNSLTDLVFIISNSVEDIVNIVNVNSLIDSVSVSNSIEDLVDIVNVNSLIDLVSTITCIEDTVNTIDVNSLIDLVSGTFFAGLGTQVTMGVVLYPNASDDWFSTSPLDELLSIGEIGYVFSPSINNSSDDLHLITKVLTSVTKVSNSIDFISKIDTGATEEQISNGIGGISKLKDFSFNLLLPNIATLDLIKFFGRQVGVVLWEDNKILNVDDGRIIFRGEIYKINRDKYGEEVKFSVRGLLSSLRTEVKGASIIDIEDETTYEPILLGYNENMTLLPLKKIKDQYGKTVLSFNEVDKYIIKDIYIKQTGVDDKPIYNKVINSFTVDNKIIFFGAKDSIFAYTAEAIDIDEFQIDLHDYYIMGFTSEIPYVFIADDYIERSIGLVTNHSCRWLFLRTEVVSDKTYYLFATVWDAFFGKTRLDIMDEFETNEELSFCVNGDVMDTFISNTFIDYSEAKIKKEIDAVTFDSGLEYKANIEMSESTNVWEQYKVMNKITEGVIIIIDEEEMLVTNVQKVYPLVNADVKNPRVQRITVERGWNNTVKTVHLENVVVKLKISSSNNIVYEHETSLKNISTINTYGETALTEWRTQNIQKFLSGTGELLVLSWGKTYQHYIGLLFDIPELKGDLKVARLIGSAKSVINGSPITLVNDVPQYIAAYISLSGVDGWFDETSQDKVKSSRWWFGRNETPNTTTYQIGKSSLTAAVYSSMSPFSTTKQEGGYSINLSGAWGYSVFKYGTISNYNGKSIYRNYAYGYDQMYGINSLDDLKDGIFITFRGSNYYGIRSTFSLTRPTLKLEMSALVDELDFYVDIIPKTVLDEDNILDEISTGMNPKFFVTQDFTKVGHPIVLIISSDDTSIIQSAYINLTNGTLYNIKDIPGNVIGTLMYSPYDNKDGGTNNFMYKVYSSEFKYLSLNMDTGVETILFNQFPSVYLEKEEHTYFKYNNFIFIASGTKVYVLNTIVNIVNNPVQVIKTLLLEYAPNINLDIVAFDSAIVSRSLWHMYKIITKPIGLIKLLDEIAKQHCLLIVERLNGLVTVIPLSIPTGSVATLSDSEFLYIDGEINYKENFSELDYLITKMDVKYDIEDDKFKGLIKSENLTFQNLFDLAKEFANNEILVNLELDTIYESSTAKLSAGVKMHYHFIPNRTIDFNSIKPSEVVRDLGEWINCTSTKIGSIANNLYLITGMGINLPFKEQKFMVELSVYEWMLGANIDLTIQEVPESSLDDYQETHTADDDIQEIPNA